MEIGELDKVSIVIPVYNCEKYLNRCIDSVLAQKYPSIEIILVEDCSNDNSLMICNTYAAKYDNIILLHHEINQGQTKTRNEGLEKATGRWVTFLDSDDAMDADVIEHFVNYITKYQSDFLICGYKIINHDNQIDIHKAEIEDGVYTRKEIAQKIYNEMPLDVLSCIGAKLYSADFLRNKKERTSDAIITNYDMAFVVDALVAAGKIAYVNWCGYSYYIRSDSVTYSYRNSMYKSLTFARKKLKTLFENEGLYNGKRLDYHKMRWGIITGSLAQEINYNRGFTGFKKAFYEVVLDDDNKETFSVIVNEDVIFRHKILAILFKLRMVRITYWISKVVLKGKKIV